MKKTYKIYPVGYDPMVMASKDSPVEFNFDGSTYFINPTNDPRDAIKWTVEDVDAMNELLKYVTIVEMDKDANENIFTGQWISPALEDIDEHQVETWWSDVPELEKIKWHK